MPDHGGLWSAFWGHADRKSKQAMRWSAVQRSRFYRLSQPCASTLNATADPMLVKATETRNFLGLIKDANSGDLTMQVSSGRFFERTETQGN